jgi:hypothetical protein
MADCLFCDRAGATVEHLLSLKWLERLMPHGPYNFIHETSEQGDVTSRSFTRRRPEVATRAVCARCNNEWMNELDLAAQPMLEAMVEGRKLDLNDVVKKRIVASWVCKVSILIDSMQTTEPALAPEHAHWLRKECSPPPGWRVWLAAISSFTEHHAAFGGFTLIRPEGRGYLGTIALNHFVAQVIVLPKGESEGRHPANDGVAALWPPTRAPVSWPPLRQLADTNELSDFARVLAAFPVQMDSPPPRIPLP